MLKKISDYQPVVTILNKPITKIFLGKVTLKVYVVKYHLGYILSNRLKRLLI